MDETKILYHVNDEETPYLVKLPISPEAVSLADLKNALARPSYKYFFKSMDDDFGYAKLQSYCWKYQNVRQHYCCLHSISI